MRIVTKLRGAGAFLAAAAVAATVSLGAGPAAAAMTWSVHPGGPFSMAFGKTGLTDLTTSTVIFTCSSSEAGGTLRSGSGLSGTDLGSISGWSFKACAGPLGLTFSVKPGGLPWKLSFLSYNSTSHTATGQITGIHLALAASGCSAVVDGTGPNALNGSEKFQFHSGTHPGKFLPSSSTMHFYNVSGCSGLIHSGDRAALTGSFTISPAQTITSP